MKNTFITILILLFSISSTFAQTKVKLLDGRTINLNSNGYWEFIAVAQQNVKLLDGRTITIYADGSWKQKEFAQEQQELTTADGTKITVYKSGTWKVKPTPPKYGTITDTRDGKVYKTVKLGTQTWFAENLAYKAGSGCWAYDNNSSNAAKYGYLYNWETAKTVCPAGWHLPSDAEWTALTNYLGGESVAGGKMKATTDWEYNAGGNATNESGFNALPAGYRRGSDGSFGALGSNAYFWSSTPSDSEGAWERYLYYGYGEVYRDNGYRTHGCSVRCSKD